MLSIYSGAFKITQEFKGATVHDGLDMVGIDSKEIRCIKSGKVTNAGWENDNDHSQGFGQYVSVQCDDGNRWYYGHLSKINVKQGQTVNIGDVIGIEGNTGHSTGSHCHCCIRPNGIKANALNIADVLGIPNEIGTYNADTSVKTTRWDYSKDDLIGQLQAVLNSKGAKLQCDAIAGDKTLEVCKKYTINSGDRGILTKWVQTRLNVLGFDCGEADGIAGTKTMSAIAKFQAANGLGQGYLGGEDWYYIIK